MRRDPADRGPGNRRDLAKRTENQAAPCRGYRATPICGGPIPCRSMCPSARPLLRDVRKDRSVATICALCPSALLSHACPAQPMRICRIDRRACWGASQCLERRRPGCEVFRAHVGGRVPVGFDCEVFRGRAGVQGQGGFGRAIRERMSWRATWRRRRRTPRHPLARSRHNFDIACAATPPRTLCPDPNVTQATRCTMLPVQEAHQLYMAHLSSDSLEPLSYVSYYSMFRRLLLIGADARHGIFPANPTYAYSVGCGRNACKILRESITSSPPRSRCRS